MRMHPVKWFFSNKFHHIEAFLGPSARHECIPAELRERAERRMRNGIRLAKWRIVLYVLIYSAVMSAAVTIAGEALKLVVSAAWLHGLVDLVFLILQVVSPLSVVALVALVPLNRTLALLEADLYVLGMELVARNMAAGGVLPSAQRTPAVGD